MLDPPDFKSFADVYQSSVSNVANVFGGNPSHANGAVFGRSTLRPMPPWGSELNCLEQNQEIIEADCDLDSDVQHSRQFCTPPHEVH